MKKTKKRILAVALGAVLVLTMAVDVAAFGVFSTALDKAFPVKTASEEEKESVQEQALETAEEIEAEGIVLLENNGALPLENTDKINLLGAASVSPVYGGTGSGGSSYLENRVDLKTAFEEAGIEVNPAPLAMYEEEEEKRKEQEKEGIYAPVHGIFEPAATEELAEEMDQEFLYEGDCSFEAMKEYSDTAVVVISRKGGEGTDLPVSMKNNTKYKPDQEKHYLELNSGEQSLIDQAKAVFGTVVVVINSGNAMELGFLENQVQAGADQPGDIDAALWIGFVGDVGTRAVADVMRGEINPSGRLADIYPYAVETIPSYYNFGTYEYTNSGESFEYLYEDGRTHLAYLLEYQEGIYVGYRYYETRKTFDYTSREGEEKKGLSYDDVVQYPFGYGLSYTDFDWSVVDVSAPGNIDGDTELKITVEVKNIGDTAGKDVVELYYTSPYHADGSRIQKSEVVLGGFAKTEEIAPGESDTVTITLKAEDMASYDSLKYYSTTGSYVLEEGTYRISLRRDSHTAEKDFVYEYQIDHPIVYAEESVKTEQVSAAEYVGKRSSDETVAVNQFDDVAGTVSYMDRDTWEIIPGSSREATKEQLESFRNALELDESFVNEADESPVFGKKGDLTIEDLKGKDYDDPMWEELLDQLSLDDIDSMMANNGWGSARVKSVGKNQIYDMDGPAALYYVFDQHAGTVTYETVTYPCEVVLASTWNVELAEKMGDSISKEGKVWGISGWYAPGANLHRNPFTGRNFEYYSEDGYLSGSIGAAVVRKAQENGMYCYMKHFALNERETMRHSGLCTWANEQSMRELYFKPFEMGVKDGNLTAMMSSYNNLGTTWAGGSKALLTNVLRQEWGFLGTVLTDNNEEQGFMNAEVAITAGGTALLYNGQAGKKSCDRLRETASGQKLLREAAHQYLYTVANSYAPELSVGIAAWRIPAAVVSMLLYAGCMIGFIVLRRKKK